jgi:hypothetical protein
VLETGYGFVNLNNFGKYRKKAERLDFDEKLSEIGILRFEITFSNIS